MIYCSVESPLRPKVEPEDPKYAEQFQQNVEYARHCLADSIRRGEVPTASHLLFPQVLNDADPEERSKGMALAQAWLLRCDFVAVYTDHGISAGMQEAISLAGANQIPVEHRRIYSS